MTKTDQILEELLSELRVIGYAQVQGYNQFGYIRETPNSVIVSRETGKDTSIGFNKIRDGINAVRSNKFVYSEGPKALRDYGITHITSPIWAILHLIPLEQYSE